MRVQIDVSQLNAMNTYRGVGVYTDLLFQHLRHLKTLDTFSLTTEKTNLLLLEMIVKVHRNGYKIAEVPVIFSERKFGVSKLNLSVESLRFAYRLLFYYW